MSTTLKIWSHYSGGIFLLVERISNQNNMSLMSFVMIINIISINAFCYRNVKDNKFLLSDISTFVDV